MKSENTTRITLEDALRLRGRTDWAKVDATTEEDIERQIDEDGDREWLDSIDWSKAVWVTPAKKTAISIRLDADILDYFKSQGSGYQSRINSVLRRYVVTAQKKAG
jgi:uncharacterized protein (DUF4415 family)